MRFPYEIAAGMTIAAGIAVAILGFESKHNYRFSGVVKQEHQLYGNMVSGYATERAGLMGRLESKVHDALRPGVPMKLYALEVQEIEYDMKRWFKHEYHKEQPTQRSATELELLRNAHDGNVIFVKTEGDYANPGDTFSGSAQEIGRLSPAFAARGVRYQLPTKSGDRAVDVRIVFVDPADIFKKRP
jgi:hypothetical protein